MAGLSLRVAASSNRVFYHFDNSNSQATAGMRTLRNCLDTAPDTRSVIAAMGESVHFVNEGAKDKRHANIEHGLLMSDLVARGVKFEICIPTLRNSANSFIKAHLLLEELRIMP